MQSSERSFSQPTERQHSNDPSDELSRAVMGDERYEAVEKGMGYLDDQEFEGMQEKSDKAIEKKLEDLKRQYGPEKYTAILEGALLAIHLREQFHDKLLEMGETE